MKIIRKKTTHVPLLNKFKKRKINISYLSKEANEIEKIMEDYSLNLGKAEDSINFLEFCSKELSTRNANLKQIVLNLNEKEKNLEKYLLLTLSNFVPGIFNKTDFIMFDKTNDIIDIREQEKQANEGNKGGVDLYTNKAKKLKSLLNKIKAVLEGTNDYYEENDINFEFYTSEDNYNELLFLNKLQMNINSKMSVQQVGQKRRKSNRRLSSFVPIDISKNIEESQRKPIIASRKNSLCSLDGYEKRKITEIQSDLLAFNNENEYNNLMPNKDCENQILKSKKRNNIFQVTKVKPHL